MLPQVGMRYFHKLKNKFHCPTINLDKVWSLVPEGFEGIPSIDVTKAGYFKVCLKSLYIYSRIRAKAVGRGIVVS